MNLPPPSWLSLTEALDWLVEQGIPDAEAKSALLRAFRNGEIQTRGRSKKYIGHNNQIDLLGSTWDRAEIRWATNVFLTPGRYSETNDFSDVDVSRSDLSGWFGGDDIEPDSINPTAPTKRGGGPRLKYDWESFYIEVAVRAGLDGLPEFQAELVVGMAQWCEEAWGEQPSDSMLKLKLSPLYNHPRKH